MKRDEIKKIFPDATDEQLKAVMDLNGADVEKEKGKATELKSELEKKNEAFEKLSAEFKTLEESNASAAEYKSKFEKLQNEVNEAKEKAEKERLAKEKADGIAARFGAVLGDKKFSHNAVKADYLRRFSEALGNKDFEGKSDAEIFHALTKDDSAAFEGVRAFELPGGSPQPSGDLTSSLGQMSMADYISARNKM